MSALDEVRAAEKRMRELLEKLMKTSAADPENLKEQLKKATEDYAKAVRDLRPEN